MPVEISAWHEIAERKIARAPADPGVIEIGRTPAWPDTSIKTLYIAGSPNIQASLLEILGQRKDKFAGTQYFRYLETEQFDELAKARIEQFVETNGGPLPIED